ncbi:MAG: helix-turn-helix transcriptional regulator [Bacteroidota bacterium]
MTDLLHLIKGIHPGIYLSRELKKRGLGKGRFALSLNEYPQTFVSITKGKRKMNIALALKIENALSLPEGFLMMLQLYHDINKEKEKQHTHKKPDLKKLRKVLFWDTDIQKINWQKQKRAVIKRVFERGNETEKKEILKFYGEKIVNEVLHEN